MFKEDLDARLLDMDVGRCVMAVSTAAGFWARDLATKEYLMQKGGLAPTTVRMGSDMDVYMAFDDGSVIHWDADPDSVLERIVYPGAGPLHIDAFPDGNGLVSFSERDGLQLRVEGESDPISVPGADTPGPVACGKFPYFAAIHPSTSATLYNLTMQWQYVPGDWRAVAVSPDCKYWCGCGPSGIWCRRVADGVVIWESSEITDGMLIYMDGKILAVARESLVDVFTLAE